MNIDENYQSYDYGTGDESRNEESSSNFIINQQNDSTNNDSLNLSSHLPGAFKNSDNFDHLDPMIQGEHMDIDESPPFTIGLELFYDSMGQKLELQPDMTSRGIEYYQYLEGQRKLDQSQDQFDTLNHNNNDNSMGYGIHGDMVDDSNNRQQTADGGGNTSTSTATGAGAGTGTGTGSNYLDFVPTSSQAGDTPTSNMNYNYSNSAATPMTTNSFHNNVTPTPTSANNQFMGGGVESQFENASIYSSLINENESIAAQDNNFTNHLRNPSIDSHFQSNPLAADPSISSGNLHHQNSNPNPSYYNELSPLTTNTSLTPSINSIHSNQPSFFSAHQYLPRNSIDVGSHRNSIDLYSKRNSIDSQSSNPRHRSQHQVGGRYSSFTTSISNYIPFMSDKNHQRRSPHSPSSGPPSPIQPQTQTPPVFMPVQPTPRQQSKHLIRSIFKSNPNNGLNNMNRSSGNSSTNNSSLNSNEFDNNNDEIKQEVDVDNDHTSEFLLMSPVKDERDIGSLDIASNNKKVKKPKRSLFNRFKNNTPSKHHDNQGEEFNDGNDSASKNSGGNNSYNNEMDEGGDFNHFHTFAHNSSRTPSSENTVRTNNNLMGFNIDSTPLNSSNTNNINSSGGMPDYAALFENVGKRKKVSSGFKSKPKIKLEKSENEMNDTSELSQGEENQDHNFDNSMSTATSNVSSFKNEEVDNMGDNSTDQSSHNTSTLANASKRILGSKLMKRKNVKAEDSDDSDDFPDIKNIKTKVMSKSGVEVDINLKTLDLPEDAHMSQQSNVSTGKVKTRGRKENKQADLTDLSKIFLCNLCSRRFKRQEHLKRHYRSLHTYEKPYDCPICHKKFSRSDNLNQHLKTHKAENEHDDELSQISENSTAVGSNMDNSPTELGQPQY